MKKMTSFALIATFTFAAASAFAATKKKPTYAVAKKECLKEEPELKGKLLQKCITQKRK